MGSTSLPLEPVQDCFWCLVQVWEEWYPCLPRLSIKKPHSFPALEPTVSSHSGKGAPSWDPITVTWEAHATWNLLECHMTGKSCSQRALSKFLTHRTSEHSNIIFVLGHYKFSSTVVNEKNTNKFCPTVSCSIKYYDKKIFSFIGFIRFSDFTHRIIIQKLEGTYSLSRTISFKQLRNQM